MLRFIPRNRYAEKPVPVPIPVGHNTEVDSRQKVATLRLIKDRMLQVIG